MKFLIEKFVSFGVKKTPIHPEGVVLNHKFGSELPDIYPGENLWMPDFEEIGVLKLLKSQEAYAKAFLERKDGELFPKCWADSCRPIVWGTRWQNVFGVPVGFYYEASLVCLVWDQPMANRFWVSEFAEIPKFVGDEAPSKGSLQDLLLHSLDYGREDTDFNVVLEDFSF